VQHIGVVRWIAKLRALNLSDLKKGGYVLNKEQFAIGEKIVHLLLEGKKAKEAMYELKLTPQQFESAWFQIWAHANLPYYKKDVIKNKSVVLYNIRKAKSVLRRIEEIEEHHVLKVKKLCEKKETAILKLRNSIQEINGH
jgi:hypothetical protein